MDKRCSSVIKRSPELVTHTHTDRLTHTGTHTGTHHTKPKRVDIMHSTEFKSPDLKT